MKTIAPIESGNMPVRDPSGRIIGMGSWLVTESAEGSQSFAWWPVTLKTGERVWLKKVWRMETWKAGIPGPEITYEKFE